ncbi:MAG: 2-phosphosulfolactate phosphatase [Gemmataceae bacterium]
MSRQVQVHLLPSLVDDAALVGSVAVVIDVLRATTTIVQALVSGCVDVRPCGEIEEAKTLAASFPNGSVVLGGERDGKPLPGFDVGNSPLEYTSGRCAGKTVVMTTTNGTRAVLKAAKADRVLAAAFTNRKAVCELLGQETRPVHILCAGSAGEVTLEDTLLAGALVDHLVQTETVEMNDSAFLASVLYKHYEIDSITPLYQSLGGRTLVDLGYKDDIEEAARPDRFTIVPELHHDPLRML